MDILPAVCELLFDVTKAFVETPVGFAQGRLGIQVKMAGQARQSKQQVSELMFLVLCVSGCQCCFQFLVLFRHLFKNRGG